MWIESIDLDDFGHFERARASGFDDGLTVIAGPQRAGKTTFMEAIRYLGYGLTSGTDAPPPTDRYDVTATVVQDGFRYELALDGYADPTVTSLDDGAPDRTARELFGDLRKTQYQQLYTVSLDELGSDPDGLGDDVDLSDVLLEAASGGNITDVPDLRDELADRATSIGGKHGRDAYELKDPLQTIEEGIEARDAATDQVSEYEQRAAEKQALEERLDEIDDEIETAETERTRLEAVEAAHESYRELQECVQALESSDVDGADRFPLDRLEEATSLREDLEAERASLEAAEREFASAVESADPDRYRERLLEARSSIERFERERSGWRERAEALREQRAALERTRDDLEQTAATLGPDWDGEPLETVRRWDADLFSRDAVEQSVRRYESARADVEELSREVEELEQRRDDLEERIGGAVERTDGPSAAAVAPVAAAGAVLALVAGGAVAVAVNPVVGVVVTTLVLLLAGSYAFSQLGTETPAHDGVAVDTLRAEAEKVRTELDAKRTQLDDREAALAAAEDTLAELRDTYELPEALSADAIDRFHDGLDELQTRVAEYEAERRRHRDGVEALGDDLEAVVETLAEVGVLEPSAGPPVDDPVDDAAEVLPAIDRAVDHLELAADVDAAAQRLRDVEASVVAVLDAWRETASAEVGDDDLPDELDAFVGHGERVREHRRLRDERDDRRTQFLNQLRVAAYAEALRPVVDREADERDRTATGGEADWLLDAYEAVLDEHGGLDAVAARRDGLEDRIEALEAEKESLREERSELKGEMESLASDEEVRRAHETIERGRRQLEPLATEYAADRVAEYLLEELHQRFVERTTGPLLDDASDVFRRITGEEYAEIAARDAFDDLDFEAVLDDGAVQQTGELSRATAEQLFLAVRLARIERYEEPLPVLLDDSLTNFDPEHVQRTLDVVGELADEVQVFLLTCHPTLAERVADGHDAQYWCLEDGAFDGPHRTTEPVRELLDDVEEPRARADGSSAGTR